MTALAHTLKSAVEQMAVPTSLEDLKKKGVQQVKVLGLERIVTLVAAAVHRSLRSQLNGVDRDVDSDAVAAATKTEFLRLLRSNEDLQRQKSEVERQRREAEEEVEQLRGELARQNEALQAKLDAQTQTVARRHAGENDAIARRVTAAMQALAGGQSPPGTDAAETMRAIVMDIVAGERAAADEARRALHDREVETLLRRISKLANTLGQTEQRLDRVAGMKAEDASLASYYGPSEGIAVDSPEAARKKKMLTAIFHDNIDLQTRIRTNT